MLMYANWNVRKQKDTICTTHIHVWATTKHHFSTYLKETENRYGNLALTKQELESPSLLWFHNHDKGSTMKHMQLSQINTAKKTEVERVDLGLPLQGPGWTDYACVQGYVGMQLHVIPLDLYTGLSWCVCFCTTLPAFVVINSLVSSDYSDAEWFG